MGPCETLHDTGLQLLFELGAEFSDDKGDRLAPFALILQTYCRYPKGKHGCIELAAKHGTEIPDTPTMAVHRGRIDLLEKHVKNDPQTVHRTFSHEEIYPPVLGSMRITHSRCTEPRSQAVRCCTCASSLTRSKLRNG